MTKRAPTLSIKDLSKAVENAVKVATEKHKVQFSPELRVGPGTIIGRQLLQADTDIKRAKEIASDIMQHVTSAAGATTSFAATRFEAVVLVRTEDGTTVGMVPQEPFLEF